MISNKLIILFLIWSAPYLAISQDLKVDHVWIHVHEDAPVAEIFGNEGFKMAGLSGFGAQATPGFFQHKGQGTSSMAVRFKNIYLELIRVEDKDLLKHTAPELGYTLLNTPETSPFGIGLLLEDLNKNSLPFKTVSYWAPWMRPLVSLAVAQSNDYFGVDPAIFVVPNYMRWDLRVKAQPDLLQDTEHSLELNDVTEIRIFGPGLPSDSEAIQYLIDQELVKFENSSEHLLEFEFDGNRSNRLDFRPSLPFVIYY